MTKIRSIPRELTQQLTPELAQRAIGLGTVIIRHDDQDCRGRINSAFGEYAVVNWDDRRRTLCKVSDLLILLGASFVTENLIDFGGWTHADGTPYTTKKSKTCIRNVEKCHTKQPQPH
jgi:hypothetical protein